MKFNRYAGLAIISLLIMVSLTTISQPTQAQDASTGWGPMVSPISIDSPTNTTYTTNEVTLTFTLKSLFNVQSGNIVMTYRLDDKEAVTVPIAAEFVPVEATVTLSDGTTRQAVSQFCSYYVISGTVELEDLQSGQHSLTVFGQYTLNSDTGVDSQTIHFTVDNETIIAPTNIGVNVGGAFESELTTNLLYASVGVFSLVAIIAYALFVKRSARSKNMCDNISLQ